MRYKQTCVAKKLQLKDTALISRWENGKSLPGLKYAILLSRLYKTTVNALFWELDQECTKELYPDKENDHRNTSNGP